MKWENRLDDPIPALVIEALARAAMSDSSPCSICNANAQLMKTAGSRRTHFHASDVGACKRKVLYSMLHPLKAKPWSNPEFLKDGHLFEHSILSGMAQGFEEMQEEYLDLFNQVAVIAASNKEELIARIPYSENNELKEIIIVGHWDGMMVLTDETGDSVYLLECKAVKKPKFDKVKGGYMDKEWYGQIQTYMKMLSDHMKKITVKAGYLLVKNRETSQILPPIRVDPNSNYLKKRRDALTEVHKALNKGTMVDREHLNKKNDECRWCRFASQCWEESDTNNPKGDNNAKNKAKEDEATVPLLRKKNDKSGRKKPSKVSASGRTRDRA